MLVIICILVIVLALVHFTIEYATPEKKKKNVCEKVYEVATKQPEDIGPIKPAVLPATETPTGEDLFSQFLNTKEERAATNYKPIDSVEACVRPVNAVVTQERHVQDRDGYH